MKIEVVEYYPFEGKKNEGTLHVYLCDWEMDLKFVYARRGPKGWKIALPARQAVDAETKERVRCPFISFTNHEKQKDLCKSLTKACREYLAKCVPETKRKLIKHDPTDEKNKDFFRVKKKAVPQAKKAGNVLTWTSGYKGEKK